MSLAKLTSLSTQTLSLLLERQRLQTMSSGPGSVNLPQITRNLGLLRTGIVAMEGDVRDGKSQKGSDEAVVLLRNQYERMRAMLGDEADNCGIERLQPRVENLPNEEADEEMASTPVPPPKDDVYTPYKDDPVRSTSREPDYEPGEMLQQQRMMMDEQDTHLDHLSQSIGRQRDISIQINDELDVHTGLLEELDVDLDRTGSRMSGARRRLERVSKGVKGNGSTVTIALLILVLLILIIVFKT